MHDLVAQYRDIGIALNPGASDELIRQLEGALECQLPDDLGAFYRAFDGWTVADGVPWLEFRLLPVAEAVTLHGNINGPWRDNPDVDWERYGVRAFWEIPHDSGVFAGAHVTGPLRGMVCFIDLFGRDLTPVYRSATSFMRLNATSDTDELAWAEWPTELPETVPSSDLARADRDWQVAQEMTAAFEAQGEHFMRQHYAFCAMALTPYERTSALLAFTEVDDMWIQAAACKILGLRRWEPAVPRLGWLAEHGDLNARGAASVAPERMGRAGTLDPHRRAQRIPHTGLL